MHVRTVGVVFAAFAVCAALGGTRRPATALEGSFEAVVTQIAVKLDDRLSSQDNAAGDVFHFELTGSAAIEGTFVAAGTFGDGVVVAAKSGAGVKPGYLTLAARSIDLPDGRKIPVGLAPGSLDRQLTREARGFTVPLGGTASVYVGSPRQTNIVYEKGTPFLVVAPPPQTPEPQPSS